MEKLKAYSNLVENLYQASISNHWSTFLNECIGVFQANRVFFALREIKEQQPLLLEYQSVYTDNAPLLAEYYHRFTEDPYYDIAKYAPEGAVINFSKLIDRSVLEETEFFKTLLKPAHTNHILAAVVLRDGDYEAYFSLNRDFGEPYFETELIEYVRYLVPHMRQAMTILKTLRAGSEKLSLMQRIQKQTEHPIFICDKNAKILQCNDCANQLMLQWPALNHANSKMCFSRKEDQDNFEQALSYSANLMSGHARAYRPFLAGELGDVKLVDVSPLPLTGNIADSDSVFLIQFTPKPTLDWLALAETYALSNKEQRLLEELYDRKHLYSLAEQFDVSYNTLKSQLQSVFSKLQVNSQTELMLFLNKLAS